MILNIKLLINPTLNKGADEHKMILNISEKKRLFEGQILNVRTGTSEH